MSLTTKDYIITKDDIEVVEKPSVDIAKDELEQEDKLVQAIVTKWNELVTVAENRTIQFSLIVNKLLKDYPDEKKKSIMLKVVKNKDLKTSISKDRIYQGLRLIERRPDLITYTPEDSNPNVEPYLKEDGSIFWEFYFELEKYALGNDSKVRLEREGRENKWSVRELRKHIYKERDIISGNGKNERRNELLKCIIGIVKNIKNMAILEKILENIIEEQKNDKRLDK